MGTSKPTFVPGHDLQEHLLYTEGGTCLVWGSDVVLEEKSSFYSRSQ